MFVRTLPLVCSVIGLASACGGSDGNGKPIDAPPSVQTVMAVTCPATPAAAVMTDDASFSFKPASVTVNQGQVVQFTNSGTHDVEPAAGMSDPGLTVGFGQTKCLMFTAPGTYKFKCGPHAFVGTVVVQ